MLFHDYIFIQIITFWLIELIRGFVGVINFLVPIIVEDEIGGE